MGLVNTKPMNKQPNRDNMKYTTVTKPLLFALIMGICAVLLSVIGVVFLYFYQEYQHITIIMLIISVLLMMAVCKIIIDLILDLR